MHFLDILIIYFIIKKNYIINKKLIKYIFSININI